MKAYELLDSPEKWCQNTWAENKEGKNTLPTSTDACKWCALGAVIKCYTNDYSDYSEVLIAQNKLYEIFSTHRYVGLKSVVAFNDDPTRTFEEVRQLLIKADV